MDDEEQEEEEDAETTTSLLGDSCRQLNSTLKDLHDHLFGLKFDPSADGRRLIDYCISSSSGIFDEKLASLLLEGLLEPSVPSGAVENPCEGLLQVLDEETLQVSFSLGRES